MPTTKPKRSLLPRLTTTFFDRPRLTALIWVVLVVFGALSYTKFLKREGFPSVNIPLAIVSGTYSSNNPVALDTQVAKPISDIALKQSDVDTVTTQSAGSFFNVSVSYKDGTDAKAATKLLEKAVDASGKLPKTTKLQYNVPYFGATGGDIQQIDLAISFYKVSGTDSTQVLTGKAQEAVAWLQGQHLPLVKSVFIKSPFESVTDPATGKSVDIQHTFDRFGTRSGNTTTFYPSVLIGVTGPSNVDVIKLDKQVRDSLAKLEVQPQFKDYGASVSASFAPSIKDNINELQRVLLEGLLAVLIVGSIVIAIRASIITVVSMITVLLASFGFLYVIGYTLNVITLFALILGLSLIVDDTIIMVEAIDAARRRTTDQREAIEEATHKVSRAMVAATSTAALSFGPLLAVGGILGSFIHSIPITIIASLIISLLVALVFIPFFARFVLLGKKQMGRSSEKTPGAGFEARFAAFIATPMLWARNSKRRLFSVGIIAIIIGMGFLGGGIFIAKNVVFNIFPPTKDTNAVALSLYFPQGTTITQAEKIADQADQVAANVIGANFEQASYYSSGGSQTANLQINITSYNKRVLTSPQIVKQLQDKFDSSFTAAKVTVGQVDLGPPSAAFTIQLSADNRPAAFAAAKDLAAYLQTAQLKRTSGKLARFTNLTISSPDEYVRSQSKPIITVTTSFDGNDTTTLVNLAQTAVKNKFTDEKLSGYGLANGSLNFDLGQESQNQSSFNTLLLAFPILLVVIYLLLAFQFRSFLQPLLIFMAIPFSIFGIMLGLDLTNNAISFFALLGFFALVGLSIKNTILLTDFANQSRRAGNGPIDAAVEALEERFRPLVATSLTAVVSLIPLALSSPFWQGLAVVLIFGLLSSTLLVVTIFPYYYLGAEYMRLRIRARSFFMWLVPTLVAAVIVGRIAGGVYGLIVVGGSILLAIARAAL